MEPFEPVVTKHMARSFPFTLGNLLEYYLNHFLSFFIFHVLDVKLPSNGREVQVVRLLGYISLASVFDRFENITTSMQLDYK